MTESRKSDWVNKGNDISLHIPSGTYYVRKSFLRQKVPNLFKSTKETQLWKAKQKAHELIKVHLDVHLNKVRTVSGVIDEFLRIETPVKRRGGTQKNHQTYYSELKKEWGSEAITSIDEVTWSDWMHAFQRRKNRKTYNDYAVYMNMLLRYSYRRKYITHLVKLPFTDQIKETGRVLNMAELKSLKETMKDDTKDQFELSYGCAMRLREVLFLTWERVDLENGTIHLGKDDVKTGSRTGRGRSFAMTPDALDRLKARRARFIKAKCMSPYVFPSRGNSQKPQMQNKSAWDRAKRIAKIKGRCRWHDLRHTALSHMILVKKCNITDVSEYAGVSVRTLQKVYLHSTAEQTKGVAILRIE